MPLGNLERLKNNRENLLLAEAAGWLHNYRKCSDEILHGGGLSRNKLAEKYPDITQVTLSLPKIAIFSHFEELIRDWEKKAFEQTASMSLRYLSQCHNTAHFDKQYLESKYGRPDYPVVQVSSPFGYATDIPANLTHKLLHGIPWHDLIVYDAEKRLNLKRAVADLFSQTTADTRRPINEVDLWSWGMLVGALYKAALAGSLLTGNRPDPNDLRWRLLSVRLNGLDYLLSVVRIPDLLARQEMLSDGLNRVRTLLEVTYPLGSEVYRDENGSVFVVPDIPNLLDVPDAQGIPLRQLIQQEFAAGTVKDDAELRLGGERLPDIILEDTPWWGQDPARQGNDELPAIDELLNKTSQPRSNFHAFQDDWQAHPNDLCTVCRLRPQGPSPKAKERHVCDICERRRSDRSQEWATERTDNTIWTNEIADSQGNLALLVGRFDLTQWLDGTLLESLLLIPPNDPDNTKGAETVSKTPSFSRLRRIWETTRRFWQEVQAEMHQTLTDDRRRLKIRLDAKPDLGPYHVYDFMLGDLAFSVVWVPESGNNGYLLIAHNLQYIARRLDAKKEIYQHPATSAIFVEDYLKAQFIDKERTPILRNPDARPEHRHRNLLEGNRITTITYQEIPYATLIPVLSEPRTFMALVPADRALPIVQKIWGKYEREMGKVRDRLPLHLNIVFADRRIPLPAVLESGRFMLERKPKASEWTVKQVQHLSPQNRGTGWEDWPETVHLILEKDGYTIELQIPTLMGDGSTPDRWYPYWQVPFACDGRERCHKDKNGTYWLHACDLQNGDTVMFRSSTFDFLWLAAAARRFEITYDEQGRRTRSRPFYLDEWEALDEAWQTFRCLSTTQIKQVLQTIETARERWFGRDQDGASTSDDAFRQFVRNTLANAQWPKAYPWKKLPNRDRLVEAAVRGELTNLAELHLTILKEKPANQEKKEQPHDC